MRQLRRLWQLVLHTCSSCEQDRPRGCKCGTYGLICTGPSEPNDSIVQVLLFGLISSWLSVDTSRGGCQDISQCTVWDSEKDRKAGGLGLFTSDTLVIKEGSGAYLKEDIVDGFVDTWMKFWAVSTTLKFRFSHNFKESIWWIRALMRAQSPAYWSWKTWILTTHVRTTSGVVSFPRDLLVICWSPSCKM